MQLVQLDDLSDLGSYIFATAQPEDTKTSIAQDVSQSGREILQKAEPEPKLAIATRPTRYSWSVDSTIFPFASSHAQAKMKANEVRRKHHFGEDSYIPHLNCEECMDISSNWEIFLEEGGDPNLRDSLHGGMLQRFAAERNIDMVQLLLDHGAQPNIIEEWRGKFGGNCPQMAAISNGDMEMIQLLLQYGARYQAAYGFWGNILHTAAYLGHFDIVKMFLDEFMDTKVDEKDTSFAGGHTALGMLLQYQYKVFNRDYQVVEGERVEIMQMLVEAAATVTAEEIVTWRVIAARAPRFKFLQGAQRAWY